MANKVYITLICSALAASITAVSAQNSTSALSSLGRTADPVSAAMGATSLTSADPSMGLLNSSALPFSGKELAASVSYGKWNPDANGTSAVNAGVSGVINGKFGLTAGFSSGSDSEYRISDESGISSGTFKPKDFSFGAGFSWRFIPELSAGVSVRYAKETLYTDYSYNTVAADIFLTGQFSDFTVTAGAGNIGGEVSAADGSSFKVPSYAGIGAAYDKTFSEVHSVRAALDFKYFFAEGTEFGIGAEYSFKEMVAVRAGWHSGADAAPLGSFFSAGLGLSFKGIALNGAYLIGDSALGNTFLVGLGYSF